jgi:hypothetical protein
MCQLMLDCEEFGTNPFQEGRDFISGFTPLGTLALPLLKVLLTDPCGLLFRLITAL